MPPGPYLGCGTRRDSGGRRRRLVWVTTGEDDAVLQVNSASHGHHDHSGGQRPRWGRVRRRPGLGGQQPGRHHLDDRPQSKEVGTLRLGFRPAAWPSTGTPSGSRSPP